MADPQTKENDSLCGIGANGRTGSVYSGMYIAPFHADTPAAKAGIKEGDLLVAAREDGGDWFAVYDASTFNKIRGLPGTTIHLRLQDTTGNLREVSIQRDFVVRDPGAPIDRVLNPQDCQLLSEMRDADSIQPPPSIAGALPHTPSFGRG